jgi:hypothetical protein
MLTSSCNWCRIEHQKLKPFVMKSCKESCDNSYAESDTCRQPCRLMSIIFTNLFHCLRGLILGYSRPVLAALSSTYTLPVRPRGGCYRCRRCRPKRNTDYPTHISRSGQKTLDADNSYHIFTRCDEGFLTMPQDLPKQNCLLWHLVRSTLFEKCEVYLSFLLGQFTSPSNVAGYPSFLTVSVTRAFTRHIPHYRTVWFTRRRSLACCTLELII